MVLDKLRGMISDYREKINDSILSSIKEETRNLLAFYKNECGVDFSDLPLNVLAEDILFSLGIIPKVCALKHIEKFHNVVIDTYDVVLKGVDNLDITDPKHQNVQKYIKSILKNNDGKNNY